MTDTSTQWLYNPKLEDFPPYQTREITVHTAKGPAVKAINDTEKFLARTSCGKTLLSYMRDNGQLCFFASGELPVAWMPIPPVEIATKDQPHD